MDEELQFWELQGTPACGIENHALCLLGVDLETQLGEVAVRLVDGPLKPGLGGGLKPNTCHMQQIPPWTSP